MKFINRNTELISLNDRWVQKKPHFIIIYGKRRVGKTELIKQFIKDKPAIYFLADKRSISEQLKELGGIIGNFFNDTLLKTKGFSDWLEVFTYLKEKHSHRFIFVVDEYPYLTETDKSIGSIFQKGWDEYLKDMGIFFILSGSSIAMMESEVLTYKSPLFGRRTGQILINPFSFKESWIFFPDKNFEELLDIYTITGGMPAYLLEIEPSLSIGDNIVKNVFSKTAFLHNEIEFILREEFREPKNYLSILKAISWGKRKFGEIVNESGLEKNILTKYLMTLEKLYIIEKEVPVTEKTPQKSRKGFYLISDNFFRFWFKYIFPYKSDLEIGKLDEVLRKIKETFAILEGLSYEKICREIIWDFRDEIFHFERVGKWWDKDNEIDIVALNQEANEILFGEVKWSNKQVGTNIYEDLKKKAKAVEWGKKGRKEYFAIFSKAGFTKDMVELAKKDKVFLVHKDKLQGF